MDNEKILLLGILLIGGGGAAYYFWNKSKNTTTNNTTKSNTTNLAAGRNDDTDLADYIPTSFVPFSFSKPSTNTTAPKQADKQAENQQIVAAMQDKPVFSTNLTSVKITNVPVTSTITKPTLLVFAPKTTTTPPKVDVNNSGDDGCQWRGDCWD